MSSRYADACHPSNHDFNISKANRILFLSWKCLFVPICVLTLCFFSQFWRLLLRNVYITCGKYFLYKNLAFTYIFDIFSPPFCCIFYNSGGSLVCPPRLLSYQDACLCCCVFLYHLHTSFDASPTCSVMQFAGTTPTPAPPPPLLDQANKPASHKYPDGGA